MQDAYNNSAKNAKTESGMFLTEFSSEGNEEGIGNLFIGKLVAGCKLGVFLLAANSYQKE